ncbi:MAG: hypothetical protein J6D29_05600 [Solobacterium sp.]|nr:hypothetical protein [Solobacterium sp.]
MKKNRKRIVSIILMASTLLLNACGFAQPKKESTITHRFATKEEGKELMLANHEYYEGFSQNDLDYKMQKVNATMEEYQAFAGEQVLEFTEEEKTLVNSCFDAMNKELKEKGYVLPEIDEITMIKTTMEEEPSASGYTHGTQIYIWGPLVETAVKGDEKQKAAVQNFLTIFFWHELFHCLTRCNPEFRKDMYKLIHFTVGEDDFTIPPSVMEYHISNPDVEHHDAYATFNINGKDIDCFVDGITTKHFEKEGDTFFNYYTTALIPTDGTDVYYTPEQASNFDGVFGKNTGYVIDPEECMADNFSYAMRYGVEGPDGQGYPNPEIIEGILSYVKKK